VNAPTNTIALLKPPFGVGQELTEPNPEHGSEFRGGDAGVERSLNAPDQDEDPMGIPLE
jgi:hypothetical protein